MTLVTGKKKAIAADTEQRLRNAGATRTRTRREADQAEEALRDAVLDALAEGASVRVVAEITGLATATVSKWKAAVGQAVARLSAHSSTSHYRDICGATS